ncbi:hypothetical protein [Streptomyces chartreusis]|uniref:hypothetical protein n=1 Tax=Streptomyces chartreusis TaxID=1969 RepID=UPI0037FBDD43
MAVVCAVLATATGARPESVVWVLLTPVGVLLAAVDFAAHRLPDVLGGAAWLPDALRWRQEGLLMRRRVGRVPVRVTGWPFSSRVTNRGMIFSGCWQGP